MKRRSRHSHFISPFRILGLFILVASVACEYGTTGSPTAPDGSTSGTTGTSSGSTTLTYVADVAPILNSDCVVCHNPSRRDGGYDLSTYAGVMRTVTAGSANSRLIKVTKSGGIMYSQFRGSASQKARTIYDWIVSSGAHEK